jgi:hypothetical protein
MAVDALAIASGSEGGGKGLSALRAVANPATDSAISTRFLKTVRGLISLPFEPKQEQLSRRSLLRTETIQPVKAVKRPRHIQNATRSDVGILKISASASKSSSAGIKPLSAADARRGMPLKRRADEKDSRSSALLVPATRRRTLRTICNVSNSQLTASAFLRY